MYSKCNLSEVYRFEGYARKDVKRYEKELKQYNMEMMQLNRFEKMHENEQNLQKKGIPEGTECVMCFDAKREVLLRPCMHIGFCTACTKKVTICPICSTSITEIEKIFMV